jgi:hypothetical protein
VVTAAFGCPAKRAEWLQIRFPLRLGQDFEEADRPIFALGHIVSGRTLKHVAAAGAGFWFLRMLVKREPIKSL